MTNSRKQYLVPGSHWVSPFDFEEQVTREFNFPDPLRLIDSTLRKMLYTAGQATGRDGWVRVIRALEELGIGNESLNVTWGGSLEPSPQELGLMQTALAASPDFRIQVYTETLLSDGQSESPISSLATLDFLASQGVRIIGPGIVEARDDEAQRVQCEELEQLCTRADELGIEVTITLANCGRRSFDRMITMANRAVALGATRLDLMDSTSALHPEAMKVFVRTFSHQLVKPVPVTMHVHDEFGLATAGAIAAATAGAHPDVSINGVSYRCGFAALEEVAMALEILYGVDTGLRLEMIQPASRTVAEAMDLPVPPLKPLTGSYAFLKHLPGDVVAVLEGGQSQFPPVSHGMVPSIMGQHMDWVWAGLSSDQMTAAVARAAGLVLEDDEIPVVRSAMDAAVEAIGRYPKWLEPASALAEIRRIAAKLRGPAFGGASGTASSLMRGACEEPRLANDTLVRYCAPGMDLPGSIDAAVAATTDRQIEAFLATITPIDTGHLWQGVRGNLSKQEEAGIGEASDRTRAEIRRLADHYSDRFGWVYLIAAQGKQADQVLDDLRRRIGYAPSAELLRARAETAKLLRGRVAALGAN
jgi:D-citramalate synthase